MSNKTCGECKYYKPYNEKICLYVHRSCVSPKTKACNSFAKPTLFDHLTKSPEVLAEKLVFPSADGWWMSSIIDDGIRFATKEGAIAATVEKLKEVYNE